ncbi:hypothetical protein P152DRAFT_376161, partial [Eremomyces bilateralis CBS 781.70]
PHLHHLSLNLHRNGTWPLESLSAIAGIPALRTLDMWLDITSECRRQNEIKHGWRPYLDDDDRCADEAQFRQPYVNETTAQEVFDFMRSKKLGDELERVTFWVGDWSRSWDGPLYSPPWMENKNVKVDCNVAVDGNTAESCVVETGSNYWTH